MNNTIGKTVSNMKALTPLKAIRAKCLDCSCFHKDEVRLCPIKNCSLYPYRFGKNPSRKGVGNKSATIPQNLNSQAISELLPVNGNKESLERN